MGSMQEIADVWRGILAALRAEEGHLPPSRPLSSFREAHFVFAMAARLRQEGKVVCVGEAYTEVEKPNPKSCDLAVLLRRRPERWLSLEVKPFHAAVAAKMGSRVANDASKLKTLTNAGSANAPCGIVVVGFDGRPGAKKGVVAAKLDKLATLHGMSRWPFRTLEESDIRSGEHPWDYTSCVAAMWARLR